MSNDSAPATEIRDTAILALPARRDTPYPTREAIVALCEFAEYQLNDRSYDGEGYEVLRDSLIAVRAALFYERNPDILEKSDKPS